MNMVLHLVKWDVRRFRILLSLWVLLVAGSTVLDGVWPAMAVAMEARQTVTLTGSLLGLIQMLFSMTLIAAIVHEHPLAGTTAFWMTRPIPWRSLFTAKLILLLNVFVAVPVVAEIVLMIVYDVPATDLAAVAAESLFFRMLWLGIVAAFAAATLNLPKFAFAVGGALIATWAVLITVEAISIDRRGARPPIPAPDEIRDPTPEMVGVTLVIVTALAFLFVLYRTRDRVRSIAIGVVGAALAVSIGSVWMWPVLAPRMETPVWALDAASLQLSAVRESIKTRTDSIISLQYGSEPPAWAITRTKLQLSGLAPGWSSEAGVRETTLRVSGREEVISRVRGPRAIPAIGDVDRQKNEVMRRVLNVNHLIDWSQQSAPDSAIIMVARGEDMRELGARSGTYDGRFRMWLSRHDIEAVLPLRVGSSVRLGDYQFVLDRMRVREPRITLLVRVSDARSRFLREPRSRVEYYIRNPVTSEAVQAAWRPLRNGNTLAALLPAITGVGESDRGFRALAVGLDFPSAYGTQQRPVEFDDTWIERGELVIVRATEAGVVERRLTIADFPIPTE
jgi:hypothetical protein